MLTLLAQAPDRGLPAQDAVIYLELSVEDAMARGGFGEERYERCSPQRPSKSCGVLSRALAHAWKIVVRLDAFRVMCDIPCPGCTKL